MGLKEYLLKSRALLSMIVVQVFMAGMPLLSIVILKEGSFTFALMTYRHIVAAVCVAPFAFFMEREVVTRRRISWLALMWIFINALVGVTMAMGLFYYGLRDTTATYAANFLNLIPIITFVLSMVMRIEKLGLRSKGGRVKIVGTLLCVGGALTYGLYHGKAFYIRPSHHAHTHQTAENTEHAWVRGSFMLMGSCFSYATWFLVQVKLARVYPSKYCTTVLTCIMASLQSVVIGLLLDRSKVSWRLKWDLQLLTIVYSGALATGASFCLMMWTIAKKGPTYPSMFNPLSLIFVAISEALLFGDAITVGSLLGMVMIIVGLYAFLWGKRNESPSPSVPLPPNACTEDGGS